jgi:hypothetical protein
MRNARRSDVIHHVMAHADTASFFAERLNALFVELQRSGDNDFGSA